MIIRNALSSNQVSSTPSTPKRRRARPLIVGDTLERDSTPPSRVSQASRNAVRKYSEGSFSSEELPGVLGKFRRAYAGNETAQSILSLAEAMPSLAPCAVGALHDGADEDSQLIVGLSMLADYKGARTRERGSFPESAAKQLLESAYQATGDEVLRTFGEDPDRQLVHQLAGALVEAHGVSPKAVLLRSVTPLLDEALSRVEPGSEREISSKVKICSNAFDELREHGRGGAWIDDVAELVNWGVDKKPKTLKGLKAQWAPARASLEFDLPSVSKPSGLKAVNIRARAGAVNYPKADKELESIRPLVEDGPTLSVLPFYDAYEGQDKDLFAGFILWMLSDPENVADEKEAIARFGVKIGNRRKLAQDIADTLKGLELTPGERAVLESHDGRTSGFDTEFLYLSRKRKEEPADALIWAAAADDTANLQRIEEFRALTDDTEAKRLAGLASLPEKAVTYIASGDDWRRYLAFSLLDSQRMESTDSDKFLKRVGLHFITRLSDDDENIPIAWEYLEPLVKDDTSLPQKRTMQDVKQTARQLITQDSDYDVDFVKNMSAMDRSFREFREGLLDERGNAIGQLSRSSTFSPYGTDPRMQKLFFSNREQNEAFWKVWNSEGDCAGDGLMLGVQPEEIFRAPVLLTSDGYFVDGDKDGKVNSFKSMLPTVGYIDDRKLEPDFVEEVINKPGTYTESDYPGLKAGAFLSMTELAEHATGKGSKGWGVESDGNGKLEFIVVG